MGLPDVEYDWHTFRADVTADTDPVTPDVVDRLLDEPCPIEPGETIRRHVGLVAGGRAYDADDLLLLLIALGAIPDPVQPPTGLRDDYGKAIQPSRPHRSTHH